jgi:hypothetical protein
MYILYGFFFLLFAREKMAYFSPPHTSDRGFQMFILRQFREVTRIKKQTDKSLYFEEYHLLGYDVL